MMIHATEVVDIIEFELVQAIRCAFAAVLQNTTNSCWVHAVLVIDIQLAFGWQVGQEGQRGR